MKLIIAIFVLLLLIGGGGIAWYVIAGPDKLEESISEGEEEIKPEPEVEKPEKKKKEDRYGKFDYADPGDRMRARSRALQDLDEDRKETMKFLDEINHEEKKKRNREKGVQKWLDKK